MGLTQEKTTDFTQMPSFQGFKYWLVFIDTFAEWKEAFPTRKQKATEVSKVLLKEIIPRFGLPRHLQSNNAPLFVVKVTQQFLQLLPPPFILETLVLRKSGPG